MKKVKASDILIAGANLKNVKINRDDPEVKKLIAQTQEAIAKTREQQKRNRRYPHW